jgi:hypothetical protein
VKWFLQAVRARWLLAAMVGMGASSALLLGGTFVVPVIDAGATFSELPFTVVTPLIAVIIAGYLTANASTPVTAVSARPHRVMFVVTTWMGLIVFVVVHWVVLALTVGPYDLSGARNVLGYATMMLAMQPWIGMRQAPIVPVAYVILATIFGRVGGVVQPWAWPVLPGGSTEVLVAAVLAIAAGVVASFARPRR